MLMGDDASPFFNYGYQKYNPTTEKPASKKTAESTESLFQGSAGCTFSGRVPGRFSASVNLCAASRNAIRCSGPQSACGKPFSAFAS
jgi:hypothetical protein